MKAGFLASNIQFLRKEKQLSQAALADHLGMTRSKIASYENGKAEPSALKLVELTRFFNISLHHLIQTDLSVLADLQRRVVGTNGLSKTSSDSEDDSQQLEYFEEQSTRLRRVAEGVRALYELRTDNLEHKPSDLVSLSRSFEHTLQLIDYFVSFNEELVDYLKRTTGKQQNGEISQ